MKYIECLEEYKPQPGEISLFLGGGISNCENWQLRMVDLLEPTPLVLLNPRRSNFPMGDPEATKVQIDWEYRHLNLATMIMFWFSPETLCPITLFEYGKWLVRNKPLFVGCHPDYKRIDDVRVQTKFERPFQAIHTDLRFVAHEIIKKVDELT